MGRSNYEHYQEEYLKVSISFPHSFGNEAEQSWAKLPFPEGQVSAAPKASWKLEANMKETRASYVLTD